MEEKKSASIRGIENWDGDFISTNRIMRFEEMVKEDGEPWTPTYLTVMEDYHNTQCPFCKATGSFQVPFVWKVYLHSMWWRIQDNTWGLYSP